MSSLNGMIGSKNGTYKVEPKNYNNADEYYEDWLKSHNELFENDKECNYERSVHRIHRLLHNSFLNSYLKMFLVRTFLRKNR
ncbi:hypothetical protein LL033_14420 [Clostridium estertheticum]|uniref:hypothetical protein n=1 Tax=Clostridium estertheticum TaxID=238834 RepID=UPI001C0CF9EA|nr:hypothetical protein [Clostridium estertheticum]MBU3218131.1 hypothetical protein [Clostridium estertheticum]WAG53846.1 hypothetical protein LL033_14420 [Clostridium estertheticum]